MIQMLVFYSTTNEIKEFGIPFVLFGTHEQLCPGGWSLFSVYQKWNILYFTGFLRSSRNIHRDQ